MENFFTLRMKRKDVFSGFLEKYRQCIAPVFAVNLHLCCLYIFQLCFVKVGLETQLAGCLYVAGPVVNEERF